MTHVLRQSCRKDVQAMHKIRLSVNENRLSSTALSESDYWRATEMNGRGWVIESDGEIVAFAVGNAATGNIWALFVDPKCEGQGHGRRLLTTVCEWLWSQGRETLWLATRPNTRGAEFYTRAGWSQRGHFPSGELRFELRRQTRSQNPADPSEADSIDTEPVEPTGANA